jgi:prophage regulatory protein
VHRRRSCITERIYKLPEVLAVTRLGRTTLYEKIKRGEFPPPVRLGARAIAWRDEDLAAWLSSRPKTNDN